ncbi:hypothetical protein PsorP6_017186 [Peronosclerospora sorghi]|uniref:Uncharacterized protein n=1 Tax=Peronosclerospora sorghi TaxID=230839 RepID=A0ACC0WCM8_9STRA|nr:hypothetical protein PsorP6_017186 [Peronosclerospora sorghi]
MHDITRGNEALKTEFNRRAHDLELKNKENAELHAQIERLKSPDHERIKDVELIQHESIELEEKNLDLQRQFELIWVEADLRLNKAHQVHNHTLEQESAHENTIHLIFEDKEALNRDMIALASERSALEFQFSTAHNEVERLKASVQKLETDNMGLKF